MLSGKVFNFGYKTGIHTGIAALAKNARLTNSPWGFAGESHDIDAELVYMRARYDEPRTSRRLTPDTHWNPSNMIYGDKYHCSL